MRKSLHRRAASVLTAMSLAVIGVLAVPAPAMAEPVCVDVPVNNENGEPIAWVCVEIDANGPSVQGDAAVTDTVGASVTVSPDGRIPSWVRVCLVFPQQPSDLPPEGTICVLPE